MNFLLYFLLLITVLTGMIMCFILGFKEGEGSYKDYLCKRCRRKILGEDK